ncbi:hypothetical protein JAAARDRAFT_141716 [Jaapia argillacea MUCL 33604]|uniref:HAD-like protein n=1 Tax=Jaapia argillacea MUCL 33604 TaxID=933084 RepID=A0A067P9S6_9AGAM|nr:hypothetical protein JAAARDRAFT_141716 [Jaapia argillacea MUCL 33604]
MWHVALPFDEVTQAKRPRLSIFDRFFFSKEVRRRQPNLAFYKAVVEKTGVDPRSVILVDDRVENVLSARSLGITGILYKDLDFVAKSLCNLFGDSVSRGLDFMERHARNHLSYTNTDVILHENFAQLLILEALENRRLVKYHSFPRIANFFQGEGTLTTSKFPCDLDTTSLYLSITHDVDAKTVNSVMDDMLTYRNSDGIIEVYFDRFRPRTDPVVCVNVLTLFCTQGRSDDLALEDTIDWVWDVLYNRAYIEGTRYYATPEAFLFFLSRFIQRCPPSLLDRFLPIYTQRLRESIGSKGDALALAMRIIACASVGLRDEVDLERLEKRQERDGGWADGWFYKYGSSGVLIANRGLTTAFAINAIREVKKLREKGVPVSYAGFW